MNNGSWNIGIVGSSSTCPRLSVLNVMCGYRPYDLLITRLTSPTEYRKVFENLVEKYAGGPKLTGDCRAYCCGSNSIKRWNIFF